MTLPSMDFETYSEAGFLWDPASRKWKGLTKTTRGISAVGAAVYAAHPSTEVLCLAYDLQDGRGKRLWVPGMPPPHDLHTHIENGGLIEAHNSMFEYLIWLNICRNRYGWPYLPLGQLRCSAAKARGWSIPGSLDGASKAIGAIEQKDKAGKRLIQLLSVPKNPTIKEPYTRRTPQTHPDLFAQMYAYCIQDVQTEEALSSVVPELTATELEVWQLDQQINARGVAIDTKALAACIDIVKQAERQGIERLQRITGGAVNTPSELQRMSAWLQETQGVTMASMDAEHVKAALERDDMPKAAKDVIGIRAALSSASIKKLFSIDRMLAADGRLHDLFVYCGADRSGRFAGRGPQPQNLKARGPEYTECTQCGKIQSARALCCKCGCVCAPPKEWDATAVNAALFDAVASRSLDYMVNVWVDPLDVIGSCLRGLFIAAPGYDLICSDYSAIEAVVLAVMAGEQWRIDVFNTHGKIYEMSASKITGIPFEEFARHKEETGSHHPMRKKVGKVAELASGYMGWIGAWKAFGADKFMSDDEIKQNILRWREASPAIVEFWGGQVRRDHSQQWSFYRENYGIEGAAIRAVECPGETCVCREISYVVQKDVLYCNLPSGRRLAYHQPRLESGIDNFSKETIWKLSYMANNTDYKKGPKGWMRIYTYGGKLVENLTQAIARDILTAALRMIDSAGFPTVLHVHDEIVAEIPTGKGTIEGFEKLMSIMPPWAAGWPIKAAGGWRGRRYRK